MRRDDYRWRNLRTQTRYRPKSKVTVCQWHCRCPRCGIDMFHSLARVKDTQWCHDTCPLPLPIRGHQ